MIFLDFIRELFSFKPECNYCHYPAQNKTIDHNNKKGYICSNCLRAIRFRENNFFKSIEVLKEMN